jgi:aerobic carbon-monoxide dehydrogenase large subunit
VNAPPSNSARFGSGRPVRRIEDRALVLGRGQFADDVQPAGQLVVRFLRSPMARGRIVHLDTTAARAMPGVAAVFTGAELEAAGVHPLPPAHSFPRPGGGGPIDAPVRHVLAVDTVGFVGEAIAAVVAESGAAADDACEAIAFEIEPLPAVVTPQQAIAADAPQLWPGSPGNVASELRHGDPAATEAAFARAAHRIELDIVNQRLAPSPIEPRSSLAWMEDGRLHVRLANQMPTAVRTELAHCLPGLSAEQVRVVVGDVGGGFGMKAGPYAEDLLVAHAARTLGRPVKWVAQRLEEFLSAHHGRDLTTHAEMALDADGRVLAMRLRSFGNVGAYPTFPGVLIVLAMGPWVTTSVYDIPLIDFHLSAVITNTTPTSPYRGAGRPEAVFITERLLDLAARRLGIDPAELRRRNLIRPEQMPYRNPMGQTYDCGQFERMLDQGLALADWPGFDLRRAASKARGRLRGRGIANFLEWTGGPVLEEQSTIRVSADGFIDVITATMPMGQGIATSYAQLAVDTFGVPLERIRVLQGDTDVANGFGSVASRSLFTGGAAVQVASKKTVDQARELAAEALEAAPTDIEYREGRFNVAGTDLGIGLFELAARQPEARIVAQASAKADNASWPNACHIAEVEIDPDTGEVEVVAYASVNDIGRVISPQIVQGQVEGGAIQGIGQALCEQLSHDPASGQLLSASFMDYAMPRVDGFRAFRTVFDTSVPCTTNLLGAKGVGELGTIGATPAVVNAVIDALAGAGRAPAAEGLQMPLTAPKVLAALQGTGLA